MQRRTRTRLQLAAAAGFCTWWGVTLGEIYFKCRVPDSEGCHWAHAFFPWLTVPLFFVIIGVPVFFLVYALSGLWDRNKS